MIRRTRFGYVLILVVLLGACSESSGPTAPLNGTISVQVLRSGDRQPMPDSLLQVRRAVDGPVVFEGRTGTDGWVTATLSEGSYWRSLLPPPGYTFSNGYSVPIVDGSITVVAGSFSSFTIPCYKIVE